MSSLSLVVSPPVADDGFCAQIILHSTVGLVAFLNLLGQSLIGEHPEGEGIESDCINFTMVEN